MSDARRFKQDSDISRCSEGRAFEVQQRAFILPLRDQRVLSGTPSGRAKELTSRLICRIFRWLPS